MKDLTPSAHVMQVCENVIMKALTQRVRACDPTRAWSSPWPWRDMRSDQNCRPRLCAITCSFNGDNTVESTQKITARIYSLYFFADPTPPQRCAPQ